MKPGVYRLVFVFSQQVFDIAQKSFAESTMTLVRDPAKVIEMDIAVGSSLRKIRVLGCASQGNRGDDEARLRAILSHFETEFVAFDKERKRDSFIECFRQLRAGKFDLFVLEGTGIAAGLPAILGSLLYRRPYVLSSGDAVKPFLSAMYPFGAPIFGVYERLLYCRSSGFIGWTPYLVGRALTLGAKRGVTIPGWAPYTKGIEELQREGVAIRLQLGIEPDAVVFGIAGSLVWSKRYGYCYGSELIRAMHIASAPGVCVLIVGDGSGLPYLKSMAGDALGKTVFLTGRVRRDGVPGYLAAMDFGSLPQTVDGVGNFRYTTKIAEYRSVGLPVITNRIPMAYDLNRGDIRRLRGDTPWSKEFLDALAQFMTGAVREGIDTRTRRASLGGEFDREDQILRVTEFLKDVVDVVYSKSTPQRQRRQT